MCPVLQGQSRKVRTEKQPWGLLCVAIGRETVVGRWEQVDYSVRGDMEVVHEGGAER